MVHIVTERDLYFGKSQKNGMRKGHTGKAGDARRVSISVTIFMDDVPATTMRITSLPYVQ